ncbi:TetR/AcrR family transcriptional regulator [Sinomonas sp. ASV322]|uniref:TetR/AcrR family transcriptional regulator n=1 Tax=Sinomonas sp. ASV322 TaxID=3041920 RepID=UPI0027DCAE34|nr:TetR/AcrR family transcriptional regulator [Sinomonas sp. ASV322]
MEAAEAEFAARGFSGGSLNTIGREAGVSKGSLFQYFTDKADLYAYLAELASMRIRAAMEAEIARLEWEDDFFGSLDALLAAWVRYFFDHPRDRALTAAANLEADPNATAAVRATVNRHYLAVIRPLLEKAAASGKLIPGSDVEVLLALLLVLLPHLAIAPHTPGMDPVLGMTGTSVERAADAAHRITVTLLNAYRPSTDRQPHNEERSTS